jgi:integrase
MSMLKPEKRGNSWRIKVYVGNKKYRSVTGATKAEAIQKAEKLQAELLAEREKPKSDNPYDDLTVAEAMERYVEAKKNALSPKTYREYTQTRKNSLKSLHDIKLGELTQEQVQLAIGEAAVDHEPKTVRNMHGLLSSALKMFRPDFTLHTKLPQKKKPDIIIPTEADVVTLLTEVRGTDIDAPVHLAALCGMRMSEILGLRWEKIDFEKKAICVCAAKVRDIDNNIVLKGTKSTAGERMIKMLPAVETALRRAREAMPGSEFVTDLKSNNIYDRYQKALKAVCDKHYTFHELRHYAASVMIMLGIPVKYIADYLGHETEDMVNRVYGHIMADKKDEMFDRLASYYNGILR